MDITIKSFPASYGESFLLTIKDVEEEYNILIDCGFKQTYKDYIKKEITNIDVLDLVILTHIDDDHIGGAVGLFSEKSLHNNLKINHIWFNDLYKILFNNYKRNIVSNKELDISNKKNIFDENVGFKTAENLFDYLHSSEFLDVWNKDNDLIVCGERLYEELYPINKKIKLVLLSPTEKRIEELFKEWVRKERINIDKIEGNENIIINKFYEFCKNYDDFIGVFDENCSNERFDIEKLAELEFDKNSIVNNSSIAFFIEIEDKRILFLGDSNANDIERALSKYIKDKGIDKICFDLIKVSHHGSKNNINNKLFDIFTAKKYLISTNGKKFGHPDYECLSKIIVKQKENKRIIFNYNHFNIIKRLDNKEMKDKYHYDIYMPKEKNKVIVINV